MKIYNYIKEGICEPILAETRLEADKIFIKTFKIEINKIQQDENNNKIISDIVHTKHLAPELNQAEEHTPLRSKYIYESKKVDESYYSDNNLEYPSA